jgi:pyruvate dehydrogenase E1 component beta subunit
MHEIMFWEAVRRAHDEELANDDMVIVMGEDVGVVGGTYKATLGLYDKYGQERVIDTPISENGFTGLGIGASFLGVRPIIEIMSVNFAWLAMDQLFNTAAKVRYMSGGQLTAPIVVRSPGGTAHQLGSQHSARMEKVFMGIAGLRVVTPSNPRQAYGLLKSAVRNISVHWCLEAAELLSKNHGIEAEVIDLFALSPLDREGIRNSVMKTHRAVIAEEAEPAVGVGAEVMAILNEECFFELDAAPVRVSALNVPIPYNHSLEKMALPDANDVVEAVRGMFGV